MILLAGLVSRVQYFVNGHHKGSFLQDFVWEGPGKRDVIRGIFFAGLVVQPSPLWGEATLRGTGRRGPIPPVRGKCPEGTKGVGISPRPTKFCFKRASIPKLSEDSCCGGGFGRQLVGIL